MLQRSLGIAMTVAVLALTVTGASALAAEFIAAPKASTMLTSGTAGNQEFQLGPFTITCASAKGRGSVVNPRVLSNDVKFSRCQSAAQLGTETLRSTAAVKQPVGFVFTAAGLTAFAPLVVTVKNPKCEIVVGDPAANGSGKIPNLGGVSYTNMSDATPKLRLFPTGFQRKLAVEPVVRGVDVRFEAACAGLAESDQGSYSGTFTDEAVRGNLEGGGEEWNHVENKEEVEAEGGGWNHVENTEEAEIEDGEWNRLNN